ncbi:MAG: hypothetical protein G01um101430_485 [Parcubacteria group bacterium Gr01-1014_30]|nr:MAG: hypothetical protein G01um101430_485 [Parcubacteria group bacterium Gr01-1014_30]
MGDSPQNKSNTYVVVGLIIAAVLLGGYFALAAWQLWWPFAVQQQQACTQEAKLCPDGSYVGRTGPNCEFAACAGEVDVSNWQTYRNEEYGIEFKYPKSWDVKEYLGEGQIEILEYIPDTHNVIYVTESARSLEEWLIADDEWSLYYDPEMMTDAEPFLIGGEEALSVQISELVLPMTIIGIRKSGRLYIIESNSGLIDILSTFRFIE